MGIFDKFKSGLGKSSSRLTDGFKNIFSKKKIDTTILEEFKELIISSDAGVDVAKEVIDEMVTVSDDQMKKFMVFCYKKFKLFLEPACVAGLAALKYKINNNLIGKNTMVILCGSNIDKKTWSNLTN